MMATSGVKFAADSGVAQAVHCTMPREAAFYANSTRRKYMSWGRVDDEDVRFEGHKGD